MTKEKIKMKAIGNDGIKEKENVLAEERIGKNDKYTS